MKDKKALTAPCGLDCFNCHIYESNLTEELTELIHAKRGVPKEAIACKGCRQQDGKHYHLPQGCATLDCAKCQMPGHRLPESKGKMCHDIVYPGFS
jgi:Protein of unknown function (DUF3795)